MRLMDEYWMNGGMDPHVSTGVAARGRLVDGDNKPDGAKIRRGARLEIMVKPDADGFGT